MKIGFDISMLVYQGSGVATHTFNLISHLLRYNSQHEYRLFYSSLRRPANFYYLDNLRKLGAKIYDYPFPPRVLKFCWNRHEFIPVEWLIGKVDFFHSSDFLRPPLLKGAQGITTIHDLTWKIYPEYHTPDIVAAHARKLERTIKHKDVIIVDSENTKHDLLKYYPQAAENKIFTLYLGVDEKYKKILDKKAIAKVLKKYQVDFMQKYLLYVGAIEPRKNLEMTIQIFAELIKDKKYKDFKFLIAGRAGWKNEKIFQLIQNLHLQNKVRFVGFVEDEDLPYFYNGAEVFLYLSKYEGFGLPPLEAAACGTKILASNNSSMKETIPSKYLCNENNFAETLQKLKQILKEPASTFHHTFTWKNTAKEFINVLETLNKK